MRRLLMVVLLCGWVLAARAATAPSDAAPPAAEPDRAGAAAQAVQPSGADTAGQPPRYVGSATCVLCHRGQNATIDPTPHGKAANPRSPAAAEGCERCHGPGGLHIRNPRDPLSLRKFTQMAPREVNETCLGCHTRASHAAWQGSPHDTRSLACTTCHSVHRPQSAAAQLKTATEIELCATCHRAQALKVKRVSHMPVPEGSLQCSSCHNPHGSTNVKQLRVGNWINESCVSCHTEKRGPFLFEHAAGRESCVSCHDPHGSSNDRLLVARLPMLCQRCHIGTRHPSTLYDNLAVQNRSSRIVGRSCVNCHSQIHGSNHPSGQAFHR